MTHRSLVGPAFAAATLTLAVAGCGSSTSPGIQQLPSGGLTAPAPTTTTTTPTTPTSTTPQPTIKLPAALNTKPTVTIPSGPAPKTLVSKDLIKGTGRPVTARSTITVQYVGVLFNTHKQFDASWDDGGKPATLPLAGFIPGWQKGLLGMREGGRRELIIPPNLAYQNHAQPGRGAGHAGIPANSTLVFVVDLHAVS